MGARVILVGIKAGSLKLKVAISGVHADVAVVVVHEVIVEVQAPEAGKAPSPPGCLVIPIMSMAKDGVVEKRLEQGVRVDQPIHAGCKLSMLTH